MAGRRANGEGTIYQRSSDGRWEAAVYAPTTGGTQKRVHLYGKTRQEVHGKLVELKSKISKGEAVSERSWTLSQYLDYWLEQVVRPNRQPATYAQCETIVRLYLRPDLGSIRLHRLSTPTLQAYVNQLIADGHSVPKVQVVRKVLSSALTRALRDEVITRNVARLVEFPTYQAAQAQHWTSAEARRFLVAAKESRLYPAFVLIVLYGLRRGEVLGLRWQDVRLEANELHICQQVQRIRRALVVGQVKTRASNRVLPLLRLARKVLESHASESDGELLFTSRTGGPLEPKTFVKEFKRVCGRAGVTGIRVHDVRHTTATLLKDLGIPVRDTQLILGHARVSTTQEIYQHDDIGTRRLSLERIERLLTASEPEVEADGDRCRQNCRQTAVRRLLKTAANSGAGWGTLTPGLFHGKTVEATLLDRITSVKETMRVRLGRWILGCVAVSVAVNTDGMYEVDRTSRPADQRDTAWPTLG
ncbi:tyrosine-type recombinase/integrase [Actinokineospora guangxiensis]|uniref:Tyrosine-type recombinase/integrase n=1 Tax=Actinokineospora guangxiensis TaxID=1490288 RepID=A0ABW0ERH7_9PSEU